MKRAPPPPAAPGSSSAARASARSRNPRADRRTTLGLCHAVDRRSGMYKLRYVAVALVAGTVGAAVALLLAPDTGRNTRRKVMRRLQREREMQLRQGLGMAEEAGEYVGARLKDCRNIIRRRVDDVAGDHQAH